MFSYKFLIFLMYYSIVSCMPPIKAAKKFSDEEQNSHSKTTSSSFLIDTSTDGSISTKEDKFFPAVLDKKEEQANLDDMKITRKKRDSGTSYLESEKERRRKLFDQISTKKDHKTEKQRLNTYASKPKTATQDPNIANPFDYDPWSVQKSSYSPDQLDKEKEQWHRETFEENNGIITAKIEFPNKPDVILTFPKRYFDTLSKSRLDATPFNKTDTVNPFKSPGLGNQKNHELKDMLTTNLLPGEIDRNNHKNTFNSRTKTESNPFSAQLSDTFKFNTEPVTDKIDENFVKNPETSFEKFKLQECIRNENQESQAHPCILLLLYQKDLFKYLNENMKIENHQTVTNFTEEKTNYDFTTPLVTINTTENTTISTFKEDSKTISFETEKVSTKNSLILDEGKFTKSDDIATSTNSPLKKDDDPGDHGIFSIGKNLGKLANSGADIIGDTISSYKKNLDDLSNFKDKGIGFLTGGDTKASSNLNSLPSDQDIMNKFDVGGNEKTGNKLSNKSEPSDSNKNREHDTTTRPSSVQKTTTISSTENEKTTPKTYTSTTEKPSITSAKPTEKYDTTTKPSSVQKTTTKSSIENEKTTPKTHTSTTEKPSITSAKPTEKYDTTTKHSIEKTTMATPKEITTKNPNQNFVPTQHTERHNQFSRQSKEIDANKGMRKNLLSSSFLALSFDWLYYIYIIALIIFVIFIVLCFLRYINFRKICCKKKKKKKRKQTCEIIDEEV